MSSLPAWILNEVQYSGLNSSNILPRVKNSSNFRMPKKDSQNLMIRKSTNFRNSSVIQRSLNPHLNDSKFKQRCSLNPNLDYTRFKQRCNNLWSKFDSRISPILEKYSINNLCKKNQIKGKLKLNKLSKKNSIIRIKSRFSKNCEMVENDFGIQCDISSDSSEMGRIYDYKELIYD